MRSLASRLSRLEEANPDVLRQQHIACLIEGSEVVRAYIRGEIDEPEMHRRRAAIDSRRPSTPAPFALSPAQIEEGKRQSERLHAIADAWHKGDIALAHALRAGKPLPHAEGVTE